MHLQEFVAGRRGQLAVEDAGLDQRLRLRGEGEILRRLGVVERLDAEGIARQHQPPGGRVVQGDRVHAAQMAGEIEAVAAIKVQRQFAIGLRREAALGKFAAQLDVIVDLGIGDERRAARLVERLVAGRQIDDREAHLQHADIARAVMPVAIRPAMRQRRAHRAQQAARRGVAVLRHDAGDAAHQPTTSSKKAR